MALSNRNDKNNQQRPRSGFESNGVASSGIARMTDEQRMNQRKQRRKAALLRKKRRQIRFWTRATCILTILIILAVLCAVILGKNPIEKGSAELKKGNYENAIEEFTKGLANLDYLSESYQGIGLAYYAQENYIESSKALELAIQKGVKSSGVIYNILSLSYIELNDYDNALRNITLAIQQLGNSEELKQQLRFNEVLCMEKTGDWEGAKAKATSYLQSYPDDLDMQAEIKFLETR